MVVKFLRRGWFRYSKLGKRRKSKQVWRRPTGRDNKMREKRRGYPSVVSIGYGTSKEKKQFLVNNLKDLEKAPKDALIILGKMGAKKKIDVLKKAKEMKLEIWKTNIDKFVKKNTKKPKKKEETKKAEKKNDQEDKKEEVKEAKENEPKK